MKPLKADIMIVGAGPVGLMCAYLAHLCGLTAIIIDKSLGPLTVGRADAFNARSLQLLEVVGLFAELYPLGKTCNTSSVWSGGKFLSRQSSWWDALEGCFHKHFLMLGQSHIERVLDAKLKAAGLPVRRATEVKDIQLVPGACHTTLANGELVQSTYLIGADGSRSFVRDHFRVAFAITRPQLVWAVIDAVITTDFAKVPEIIVFQTGTADVAWIPREGAIDRFYVRMDTKDFQLDDAVAKIRIALQPHSISFPEVVWFSRFSVKESVAEAFTVDGCVFLAGDACHSHSVNGGQGLNTGLGDAFNLIWKIGMVLNHGAPPSLLQSYEDERKPVATSVVETSGELVRATKFSSSGSHAQDYVAIVRRRSGHITGMGIHYGDGDGHGGLSGHRLFDFKVNSGCSPAQAQRRIYSLLNYACYTLLIFSEHPLPLELPDFVQAIQIYPDEHQNGYWSEDSPYQDELVLIRPDSYIAGLAALDSAASLLATLRAALDGGQPA